MNILYLFILINIVNVIIQTVKSICTVKCNKWVAALVNCVAYALYTYVIIYTTIDGIAMWHKAAIVGFCNLIGVFVVKYIEEKSRKQRLWKIEFTVNNVRFNCKEIIDYLDNKHIPHRYLDLGMHTMFSCYCDTGSQSNIVKDIIKKYDGKYFVTESKVLYR